MCPQAGGTTPKDISEGGCKVGSRNWRSTRGGTHIQTKTSVKAFDGRLPPPNSLILRIANAITWHAMLVFSNSVANWDRIRGRLTCRINDLQKRQVLSGGFRFHVATTPTLAKKCSAPDRPTGAFFLLGVPARLAAG